MIFTTKLRNNFIVTHLYTFSHSEFRIRKALQTTLHVAEAVRKHESIADIVAEIYAGLQIYGSVCLYGALKLKSIFKVSRGDECLMGFQVTEIQIKRLRKLPQTQNEWD